LKAIGCIVASNAIILTILLFLGALYLLTLILIYEALFATVLGLFQILGSYVYRADSIPYRFGFRTGWWDFRKFAELKPEERNRCRKEGVILIMIGLVLGFMSVIAHFSFFTY